jgi:Fe-S-cluster containining protein
MVVLFWAVSIVGLLSPSPQDQTATWLAVRGVLTLAHSAANTKHIVCQREIRNASALRLFDGIALGYGMQSIATVSKSDAYNLSQPLQPATSSPCTTCGACCSYSAEWPRFSTEDDEALARIPEALVAENLSGMRCDGERCMALDGKIGEAVRCTIYADRPQVCRDCQPGDEECQMARARHGFPPIAA